jgi:Domain of unknown function (DUF4160)
MRSIRDKMLFSISTVSLLEGEIDSRTAKGLIRKWARIHKAELNKNWENMRQRKGFNENRTPEIGG